MTVSLFVYGTLMSPQVVRVLLGRVPSMVQPAVVNGYSRHPVRNRVYPGMIPSSRPSSKTRGLLLGGIEPHELEVLDWFEGDDYEKHSVTVRVDSTPECDAYAYVWNCPLETLDVECEWDFERFIDHRLDWYLETTVRPCRAEIDELELGRP